jgi:pseudomonalisin
LSYGQCEATLGSGGAAFWNNLWQQAAAQGISVFVSSGDSGAAGCASGSTKTATQGRGVNGLCSSHHSSCVGGTQFTEGANPGQYWTSTNGTALSSAIGYIPEAVWNQSGPAGTGLWASGGGASAIYTKPEWQTVTGVPSDGKRDVPDISAAASSHDAYVIKLQGSSVAVGGTSAAAPAVASAMALVLESSGAVQGNVNPSLYALANHQLSGGGPIVLHDIVSGNNSVPGVTGFNAGVGYDLATGLGSMDADMMVTYWKEGSARFVLKSNSPSLIVGKGGSHNFTLTMIGIGNFSSPVTLVASGMPAGISVSFSSTSMTAPASVTATVSAAASAVPGDSTLTITASGGGLNRSVQVLVSTTTPTFALSATTANVSAARGRKTSFTLKSVASGGFQWPVGLSVSGLPKGVTAAFSPASIASPGNGVSTLKVNLSWGAVAGISKLTVTAVGGGITKTQGLILTVTH